MSTQKVQSGLRAVPGVKQIIAVASGKGGVGKSTTAVNIALSLQQMGARVGILDADIYGPNQPYLLGLTDAKPTVVEGNRVLPPERYGLQVMSIGFFVTPETPMIWRGPMVTTALQQLLLDTVWNQLDYLILDLPPGTGDIQLTMAQKIPVSGAVIVTTPQDIALLDVKKAIAMFQKVKVPILGVIENMSTFHCQHCGQETPIFGHGGGEQLANQFSLPLLGQIPLERQIRESLDSGTPLVLSTPAGDITTRYRGIAQKIANMLKQQPKNYALKFPKIVIETASA